MTSFGNPVAQALIRPPGSPLIVGDFRVTAAFGAIDVSHPTPHIGVDIGNGRCGELLLAMATGPITLAGYIGKSLVVRGKGDDNPEYEWAIAHCSILTVKKGQRVSRGQRIGTLGKTGADACHAHLGCKHNGVEVDIWPLLDQNQETDMLKGTNPVRIVNRQTTVLGDNTRFRPSPGTAEPQLAMYPAGTLFYPDYLVQGGLALGSRGWYGGWGDTPKGREFGYIHEKVLAALTPIEQAGYSDADLNDAKKTAARAVANAASTQANQYP